MTATTTGNASANDKTFAVIRDTAEGSKNRTIPGAIKGLFRLAVKTVTRRDAEDEPQPNNRRRGGDKTGSAAMSRPRFRLAVKAVAGRAAKAPVPQRDSGAAGRAFGNAARIAHRAVQIPSEAYAAATAYLCDTVDWLNHWDNDSGATENFDNDFDTAADYSSPHL